LVLLSCDDELGEVGLKNPNRDFDVVAKEFIIPTTVFQMDSVSTSYGYLDGTRQYMTPDPPRWMVGSADIDKFGKSDAIAYTQYWAASFPVVPDTAEFESLELTLIFDYYWLGDKSKSDQLFEVHELTDSVLTYRKHYTFNSTPYGKLLGSATKTVDPVAFDENYGDNHDTDTNNDIIDSLNVVLDPELGQALLDAAIDTVGTNETNYNYFYKFRRNFKGFAITAPGANKIVGFSPNHAKTRLTLRYRTDTTRLLTFLFTPASQARGVPEFMSYTQLQTDRAGTPLATLPAKYVDYEPADGMRYVQAGTGVVTKLDFSEVYDYFKNIPDKALSVAKLEIQSTEQPKAPTRFKLRVLRPDNREQKSSKEYFDGANDPYSNTDYDFVSKHRFDPNTIIRPFLKCDVIADNPTSTTATFTLDQISNSSGTSVYTGFLTNYLNQELSLSDADFLRYYALLPHTPDIAFGASGFYFPADKVKLTIYYTTPKPKS
jgi:hypothetical protein